MDYSILSKMVYITRTMRHLGKDLNYHIQQMSEYRYRWYVKLLLGKANRQVTNRLI